MTMTSDIENIKIGKIVGVNNVIIQSNFGFIIFSGYRPVGG